MDYEVSIIIFLVGLMVFFSLDFDRHYSLGFDDAARHPFFRFLAGLGVVYLASLNPIYAVLALMIVFFWIADVNLLSSLNVLKIVEESKDDKKV
jgi:hypothetical protein